ncbi:cysteine hydrolase [Bacillus luteolus]|uniref:Cysteine hydrolase n=1 Tax=Litchfieldia luteola TaxID=682179 RepID=A0ABR9QGK2_9BACI|nr:cysteine hydrolase family protein [Cytobacillus luteolus]MBE4907561.1 cysteine hydrolase [Cytobacillus luteolus]MBP1944334.1 nicotinamidase-related amidase [Cytobacillus luteolus]
MSKTAVLVIDAQVGIIEGPSIGPVFRKEQVLEVMKNVIERAREDNLPVIYVQDLDVGANNPEEQKIHPSIAPQETEFVIQKTATNAFYLTTLSETLKELNVEHLVIVGCKTEFCVDTTSRSATVLGFDVTLVADGHSTTDNNVLSAEQIIAHHNCNLHGLDNVNHFILVRNSTESIFEHKHLEYK